MPPARLPVPRGSTIVIENEKASAFLQNIYYLHTVRRIQARLYRMCSMWGEQQNLRQNTKPSDFIHYCRLIQEPFHIAHRRKSIATISRQT